MNSQDGSTTTSTHASEVLRELFGARYSCRAFLKREVDRETIARLLELSQLSPSWCNTQPWRVHLISGEPLDRLRATATAYAAANQAAPDIPFPERYEGIAKERRFECAMQLYDSLGIERGDRAASGAQAMKNFEFFGAPHLAVFTTERALGPYGGIDCGVYLGHFLLAAQSLGIATIPQAAIAAVAPVMREQLGIAEDRDVIFGVSFGYADEDHPVNGFRTTRAEPEDVATWVED
jgi:nitroreductase